ncbi:MAG: SURF1 family protein [Proteobacteria bacterium]|nr:SURF1 family protein [Pseudomonadota bacterium]
MTARLAVEPAPVTELLPQIATQSSSTIFRRVLVRGSFNFEHEMVLRNRRHDGAAGVHLLTPLKLENSEQHILVNRGFLPLSRSERKTREAFRGAAEAHFVGLIKESSRPAWLAPQDPPTGGGAPWVDAWLRVDLEKMSAQLPYPLAPAYVEIMSTVDPQNAQSQIVKSSAGKEELLIMGLHEASGGHKPDFDPSLSYPIPVFDTVLPAGRHLGYVYEWATMAVATLLIGLVLQLRPPRTEPLPQ